MLGDAIDSLFRALLRKHGASVQIGSTKLWDLRSRIGAKASQRHEVKIG